MSKARAGGGAAKKLAKKVDHKGRCFTHVLAQMVRRYYRVFRSRMSFSSCLKMTENRNLHNKTRLHFYQNSPPFYSIAINFIKICHKCSKFHKIWKNGDKNLSNFFSSKLFFQSKYFILMPYQHILRRKKKWKILYVMIFFFKKLQFKFFFNFYYSQRNEWHNWTTRTIINEKNTIWEIS